MVVGRCAGCDRRVSATAGTVFHGTRTSLTVWFSAAWHLTSGKGGISATELQREMQFGFYQTAWAMLHRYRSVMVRPGRARLTGDVEVDEAFLGGPEPGITGTRRVGQDPVRCRRGTQQPQGTWAGSSGCDRRCSRRLLPEGHAWALHPQGYVTACGRPAHEALPDVHPVLSLVKRWVMGTLHGSVSLEHIQRTSTSGCSGSTVATHAAAASCSNDCSSKPSKATPSPTRSCARPAGPARRRRPRSVRACSRPASNLKRPAHPGASTNPERFQGLRHRDGDPTQLERSVRLRDLLPNCLSSQAGALGGRPDTPAIRLRRRRPSRSRPGYSAGVRPSPPRSAHGVRPHHRRRRPRVSSSHR